MEAKTINNLRHINYLIFKLFSNIFIETYYILLEEPLMLMAEKEGRRVVRGWRQRECFYTHLMSKASATCTPLQLSECFNFNHSS